MSQRTRAGERAAEIDISPTKLLADIEALTGERDAALQKAEEYLAGLQRERAEFSNYRRRTTEEREAMLGLASEDLIRKVLVLADDFDLAIDARPAEIANEAWVEGVAAIDRKLRVLLESEGVTQIDASPGTPFDPREHVRSGHGPQGRRDRRGDPARLPAPRSRRPARARRGGGVAGRRADPAQRGDSGRITKAQLTTQTTRQPQETRLTWPRSSASTSGRRTASSR